MIKIKRFKYLDKLFFGMAEETKKSSFLESIIESTIIGTAVGFFTPYAYWPARLITSLAGGLIIQPIFNRLLIPPLGP